ncbi:MAG: hypothetical protein AMXMBFR53_26520 [Gemmatimonadota bacterium]
MDDWCRRRALSRGGILTLDHCWRLAKVWYRGRLDPTWRGRSLAEAQAVLEGVGLTGAFWRMAP